MFLIDFELLQNMYNDLYIVLSYEFVKSPCKSFFYPILHLLYILFQRTIFVKSNFLMTRVCQVVFNIIPLKNLCKSSQFILQKFKWFSWLLTILNFTKKFFYDQEFEPEDLTELITTLKQLATDSTKSRSKKVQN